MARQKTTKRQSTTTVKSTKDKKPSISKKTTIKKKPVKKKITKKPKSTTNAQSTSLKMIPRPLGLISVYSASIDNIVRLINNIELQSYDKKIDYVLNIFVSSKDNKKYFTNILDKYNTKIKIQFQDINTASVDNLVDTIQTIKDYHNYNLYIHLTMDYIFETNYISTLIDNYIKKKKDVICVDSKCQVNNNIIEKNEDNNLSYNYIFNKKALDVLIKNDCKDLYLWRDIWLEHKIKIQNIKLEALLKHYHQQVDFHQISNQSQTDSVNTYSERENEDAPYAYLEDDNFTVCIFEHNFWSSYVYLNKRNNRMYNIFNDDHGAFEILNNEDMTITWDTWGEEKFYKKYHENGNYYYSVHQ
jgi:hypothetical protein